MSKFIKETRPKAIKMCQEWLSVLEGMQKGADRFGKIADKVVEGKTIYKDMKKVFGSKTKVERDEMCDHLLEIIMGDEFSHLQEFLMLQKFEEVNDVLMQIDSESDAAGHLTECLKSLPTNPKITKILEKLKQLFVVEEESEDSEGANVFQDNVTLSREIMLKKLACKLEVVAFGDSVAQKIQEIRKKKKEEKSKKRKLEKGENPPAKKQREEESEEEEES